MTHDHIPKLRLQNQGISQPGLCRPVDIVSRLGAVQAQDYAAAKWALGLRLPGSTHKDIEAAFDKGEILRTHLMRPTWHFVAPEDIRWIMELTAARVNAQCAYMNRQMELTDAIFKKSNKTIIKALKGNNYLTRNELGEALQKAGIATNDLRLTCIAIRAELDAVICSGPVRGKQFTYALMEERAPAAKALARDKALSMLAKRYFVSYGPATLQDFAWWSGLAAADAKNALEMVAPRLQKEIIDGSTYWFDGASPENENIQTSAYLLPNYDEYTVAYKDRGAVFDPAKLSKANVSGGVIFNNTIIMNGQVAGTWKRSILKDKVIIDPLTFTKPTKVQKQAIDIAAGNYAGFLGVKAEVNW